MILFDSNLCVQITRWISQFLSHSSILFTFEADSILVTTAIFIQRPLYLSMAFSKCSYASTTSGAMKTDCFLLRNDLYIALNATSVFPKPTSQTRSLSIGWSFSISSKISQMTSS